MERIDTLIDAGPLVAAFYKRDEHHEWARRQLADIRPPMHTCEAVLSEAFHLLEDAPQGGQKLLAFLERGFVKVSFSYTDHAGRVHELLRTYTDQPMSFADACLVHLAELHPASCVFTTDGDFFIYRKKGDERINVLAPSLR